MVAGDLTQISLDSLWLKHKEYYGCEGGGRKTRMEVDVVVLVSVIVSGPSIVAVRR